MPERILILGVPVDAVTLPTAVRQAKEFLASSRPHHIMTPNPEMLVEAKRNPTFRNVLLLSDLNIPDGAGLLWAARRLRTPLPERVAGTDLLSALCLEPKIGSVFLLGAKPGVAERAAQVLKTKNPGLQIAGTFSGSPAADEARGITERINASGARILFVAYGSPAQDLWIHRHLPSMPQIRIAMGVGGAFDFLAGVRSRAPQWMRSLYLEWLWRLTKEPRRLKRIATAVIVFPWMILTTGSRADARTS